MSDENQNDAATPAEIDTTNKFMVGSMGERVVIMYPPRGPISRADALLLAAYLVVMFDQNDEFEQVKNAILGT